VIFNDGTYDLHASNAVTYIIMSEDFEGSGVIVVVAVVLKRGLCSK
jgi:hypothetical protein